MNIRSILLTCASAAACISLSTTAQAERLPFMPQGETIAPPPGFTDLCERDVVACGVAARPAQSLLASNTTSLITSSLGGRGEAPRAAADFDADRAQSVDARPSLIQLARVEAYRPAIDATFVAAGEERAIDAPATRSAEISQTPPSAGPALLDKSMMKLVNTLNQEVNRDVHKANDFDLYGLLEFWTLPRVIDGKMYGDCEDYALEKRRRLIAAGVPAEAMSMAVAVTARGETHAVLVVSFQSGDWVLDNLTPWATPWNELNYRWVQRQVAGSPDWKRIS